MTDVPQDGSGGSEDPDLRPARGYSWDPFVPGNEVALKHGMYSPRRIEPLADGIVQGILVMAGEPGSSVGYLADPSYRLALWSYGRVEARIQLGTEWLLDNAGDFTAAGEVRAVAEYVRRLEAQALKHRTELGLSPLSRARMGRDVAAGSVDVAKLMAALAEAEREGDS